MSTAKKVLAAGHICLDITPVIPPQPGKRLADILVPGRLLHVGQPGIHLGGSVANTGLALHLFGADVQLAANIGADDFGQLVKASLAKYPCKAFLQEDAAAGTSYSIVVAVPGIDRLFLHNPGANDTFTAADITDDMLAGVSHLHFGYPPVMLRMVEADGGELYQLLRRAKALGVTTSVDMAAVDPSSPAGGLDWPRILARILPLIDFFVPSIEEICFMLDRPRYHEWNARAAGRDVTALLRPQEDIAPLADALMALGAKALLLKCGAPGLYYRTAGAGAMQPLCAAQGLLLAEWSGLCGFEKSFVPSRVVSATGAGDTCIAAFLAAMLRGAPLKQCVGLAAAAGAACVSAYDALSGLEPLDTLQRKIDAGWEKV